MITARKPESLSFRGTSTKNYLAVKPEVTDPQNIQSAFAAAVDILGRVDVVINNAGNGLAGPFEELADAQIKTQVGVSFFGHQPVPTLKLCSGESKSSSMSQHCLKTKRVANHL